MYIVFTKYATEAVFSVILDIHLHVVRSFQSPSSRSKNRAKLIPHRLHRLWDLLAMAAIGWQRRAVLHHYHAPIILVDAFLAVMVVVMVLCPKEDQEGGRADVQSPFLFSLHIVFLS